MFPTALLLFAALLAPGPSAPEAAATRSAVEEVRILATVNTLQLTPDQGAELLKILDDAETRRAAVEKGAAAVIDAARAAIEQSLDGVAADPTAAVPAEAALNRALRDRDARLAEIRAQSRQQLQEALPKLLSPDQVHALLLAGAETALEERLFAGGRSGAGATGDLLQELELLRQGPPADSARRRGFVGLRIAGGMDPAAMREYFQQLRAQRGAGPPSPGATPPGDPQVQQRLAQVAAQLDRVRAMSPVTWQSQRVNVAAQLARLREMRAVQESRPEDLLAAFIDRYLLQPHSDSALRARFPAEDHDTAAPMTHNE